MILKERPNLMLLYILLDISLIYCHKWHTQQSKPYVHIWQSRKYLHAQQSARAKKIHVGTYVLSSEEVKEIMCSMKILQFDLKCHLVLMLSLFSLHQGWYTACTGGQ